VSLVVSPLLAVAWAAAKRRVSGKWRVAWDATDGGSSGSLPEFTWPGLPRGSRDLGCRRLPDPNRGDGACGVLEGRPRVGAFRKGGESLLAKAGGGKSELRRARRRATLVLPGIRSGGGTVRSRRRKVPQRTYRRTAAVRSWW